MKDKKNLILTFILAGVIFFAGYSFGYNSYFGSIGGFVPKIYNQNREGVDFSLFWKTWDKLQEKYAGDVNREDMLYGAISGMVESTGDPYTIFMNPEEAKTFQEELQGSISGIGAEIGIKNDNLTIIAPLEGYPAQKAGLKAGDIIAEIDGDATTNINLNEAVMKIRGEPGSKVTLTVIRDNTEKEFTITREEFTVESVKYEIKDNVLVISISRFDNNTTKLVKEAENFGISKNVDGVIVDLRNNPGGYLESSIETASEFVGEGVIVVEKDKDGNSREFKARTRGKMTDKNNYPLVVLINKGSASASEIFAGAVKDHNRGTLVGESTFGKGSVQEIEELNEGAQLKVTVGYWYTPNGKSISEEGLDPDVEVELTEEDFDNNLDPQMNRALEILNNKE